MEFERCRCLDISVVKAYLKQHTGRNKGTLSEECLHAAVVHGVLALVQGSATWLARPSAVAHVSFERKNIANYTKQ